LSRCSTSSNQIFALGIKPGYLACPLRRYGVTARGSALGDLPPKPAPYDYVCHFDHMWASAVARGNSKSAEGPAIHVPWSL